MYIYIYVYSVCVNYPPLHNSQLDDNWGDLLQQYRMMLFESIGYYGNAIKEMEDLGGVSARYPV